MKPKSDNLFHFTKTIQILKLILKEGIKPRYCLEDFSWSDWSNDYMAYPMSCFCDIPLSRISEHTDFYGDYGIGFSKQWGLKNKLNPVVYTPPSGKVQSLASFLLDMENPINKEGVYEQHLYNFISLIKPTIGKMIIAGKVIEKEFYQENEWRHVPIVQNLLLKEEFENRKDSENEIVEQHGLAHLPNDIRYIFVKEDSDIPEIVDFIHKEMGMFPLNDLKILQSRIVSLETLRMDL